MSEYEKQAEGFLARNGLRFRVEQKGGRCPPWCGEDGHGCCHGDCYRVTLSRRGKGGRLSFDFWNSQKDSREGVEPSSYSVLACISGDIYTPEDFAEFASEYGLSEDSRKAEATWRRCVRFARRLRAFFSEEEQKQLEEIR